MRNILLLLFLSISFFSFAQNDLRKDGGYVYDFGNILTESEEAALEQEVLAYEKATSIEIAIVTVQELNGHEISDYAVDLFTNWGIGKKDKNNGLLFLIAPNDRKWWITTGYGLEEYLTDAYTKRIATDILPPNFKKKQYFTGINEVVKNFEGKMGTMAWPDREADIAAIKIDNERKQAEAQKQMAETMSSIGTFLLYTIFLLFIIGLLVFGVNSVIKRKREQEEAEENERRRIEAERIAKQDLRDNINKVLINFDVYIQSTIALDTYKLAETFTTDWNATKQKIADMIAPIPYTTAETSQLQSIYTEVQRLAKPHLAEMAKIKEAYVKYAEYEKYFNNVDVLLKTISKRYTTLANTNRNSEYKIDLVPVAATIKDTEQFVINELNASGKLYSNNKLNLNDLATLGIHFTTIQRLIKKMNDHLDKCESELNTYKDARNYILSNKDTVDTLISQLEQLNKNSDVQSKASSIQSYKARLNKMKLDMSLGGLMLTYSLLLSLISDINNSIRSAENEISSAKNAREAEKRRKKKQEEDEEDDRRRRRNNSYSSFGGGYGGSSSSSSSSSSFSDFGGGSTGGGGSGGDW